MRWADTGMDGSVPGGRKTGRQTREEAVRCLQWDLGRGRHGEGRYGGWGDGNEFSEGSLEEMVVMREKNKKSSAARKPHC